MILIAPIAPKYKKENGLYVLDIDSIEVPFIVKEKSLVYIPPGELGGNHRHPRQEAFVGIEEDLQFIWVEDGETRNLEMNRDHQLQLIMVPTNLEHAVFNRSKNQMAILLEFADGAQENVETVKIA